jgi:dUTPase
MLSDKDLSKKLGKNISIYPFLAEKVEGASIFVTASKFAWSLREKTELHRDGEIVIPPNDTALIVSNEFFEFDMRHAGICLARVPFVAHGLGYSSTAIKPGYKGKLLIALQNNTNNDVTVRVGDDITVVMFYELSSEAKIEHHPQSIHTRLTNAGITIPEPSEMFDSVEKSYKIDNETLKKYDAFRKQFKGKFYNIKSNIFEIIVLMITVCVVFVQVIFFKKNPPLFATTISASMVFATLLITLKRR